MSADLQDLLSILQELQAGKKPYSQRSGICYHVKRTAEAVTTTERAEELEEALKNILYEFCGDCEYVVKHPELSPQEAYQYSEDHWDRQTAYGRNRWALVDQLVAYLEAQL